MAEIMLLLVFCLLIAMGVSISHEFMRRKKAENKFEDFKKSTAINSAVLDAIRNDPRLAEYRKTAHADDSKAAINEFWRDLISSYETAQELKKDGLSNEEIKQSAEFHARVYKYRDQLKDPAKVLKDESTLQALRTELGSEGDLLNHPAELAARLEKAKELEGEKSPDRPTGHKWPPIITISDADRYFFAVGKP